MLRKITFIVILILLFCSCDLNVNAATYWIAPDGRFSAKGTEMDPFGCIEDALERVGGGNTFIFMPGEYIGAQITISPEYSGTAQNPTVLKSQNKYEAILHGSPFHNIYVKEGCQWVIIDGFESSGARYTGIKSNADYTVIRNCRIHNNALQGIEAHNVYGTVIENNIIEYNGEHLQFDHGMYVDGENLTIRNNIVRFNSGWGIHLYPEIADSKVENNLVYGNNRWGVCVYSKPGAGSNIIVNNTIVLNGGGIAVKNGQDEIIANNIIANNTMWMFEKSEPIQNLSGGDFCDGNVVIDYNLCFPRYSGAGPHGISVDPRFLDASKGTFYLTSGSPAIGMGSWEYAPERDFFNRSMPKGKAPDLGCFPYDSSLLTTEARKGWYYKWPFLYKGKDSTMPDLWKLPESDGSDGGYKYK
jgi:parallel beta-helix repeat protein